MPKTKREIAHDVDELLAVGLRAMAKPNPAKRLYERQIDESLDHGRGAKGGGAITMRHLESIAARDAVDAETRHPREVKELEKHVRAARNSLIRAENAAAAIWGRGSEQVRDVEAVIRMLG